MRIDFLRERFREAGDADALIWREQSYSYAYLLEQIDEWNGMLDASGVPSSSVVSVEADFSPKAIALMLALIERNCEPLSTSSSKSSWQMSPSL